MEKENPTHVGSLVDLSELRTSRPPARLPQPTAPIDPVHQIEIQPTDPEEDLPSYVNDPGGLLIVAPQEFPASPSHLVPPRLPPKPIQLQGTPLTVAPELQGTPLTVAPEPLPPRSPPPPAYENEDVSASTSTARMQSSEDTARDQSSSSALMTTTTTTGTPESPINNVEDDQTPVKPKPAKRRVRIQEPPK